MRKPLIAANWKMHKNRGEAEEFCQQLKQSNIGEVCDVLICPSFTCLEAVGRFASQAGWGLGAQNCYYEPKGAFTGEVSIDQLTDMQCTHVIIGHSERRQIFAESDLVIDKKLQAAIAAGLVPVFCVGETLEERRQGRALERLQEQFSAGTINLSAELDLNKFVIAYEPIWAIGTGETASAQDAQEAIAHLRSLAALKWGQEKTDASLRILYGGSVKPDNAQELGQQEDIDGALVGGASLEAGSFAKLIEEFAKGC